MLASLAIETLTALPALPAMPEIPSIPQMPSLGEIPSVVWIALGVVILPFAIIFGMLGVKLLWGFWPLPASIIASGYAIFNLGIDFFWLIAIGIMAGLVFAWLWQGTRLFLKGDKILEKMMLIGD